MKFLARRYPELMRSWFEAGNEMHVSCLIMKENSDPDQAEELLDEA